MICGKLLSSEGNVLEQYRSDFSGYNIEFKMTDDAISDFGESVEEKQVPVVGHGAGENFRDFKFELPSTGIRSFEADEQTVLNPEESIQALIEQNRDQVDDSMLEDVDRFVEEFKRNHGFG